jgi:ectoine hydroxylase-related dioxygenase (phytanoyl-CoA dioxygenase family)
MRLTQQQIDTFHRNGYLVARQVLRPGDLHPLIDDFNALIDEVARQLQEEGAIQNVHAGEPFERRIACLTREAGTSLQSRVSFPVNLRRPLFDFLHTPRLLDAVESLVGPEITCNPTHHVRPKLPETIGAADWIQQSPFHQDAAVLLPEADDTLIVTSWIPLVDATEENGTLRIFPGLHTGSIRTHVRCPYGWAIAEGEMPEGDPVTLPIRKGDVIFIHCRTPHGSGPNRTDRVRWSLDLRWHDARKPGGRPLPDLLVRSRTHPLTTYEAWLNAWEEVKADPRPRTLYRWPV